VHRAPPSATTVRLRSSWELQQELSATYSHPADLNAWRSSPHANARFGKAPVRARIPHRGLFFGWSRAIPRHQPFAPAPSKTSSVNLHTVAASRRECCHCPATARRNLTST
jgi:hypothetical protein